MKKLALLSIVIIISVMSCSQPTNNMIKTTDKEIITISKGMNYLGDISKIYSSSDTGRFVTNQIIENFYGHTVRFEGNIVEYNSIKPEILAYVESLDSNNALMHQHYSNIEYDDSKKYVEFSSYTDTTSNKVVLFELRVFFGNFLEIFETNIWYAKSVSFNPSFTKDLSNQVDVDFGELLEGAYEDDEKDLSPNNKVKDLIDTQLIGKIGVANKIYSASNIGRFYTGQIITWGDRTVRFQGNLVEYNTVNQSIIDKFTETEPNAFMNQNYSNVNFHNSKTYIEVAYYKDVDTNEIVIFELRLIDNKYFEGDFTSWYAKSIDISQDFIDNL